MRANLTSRTAVTGGRAEVQPPLTARIIARRARCPRALSAAFVLAMWSASPVTFVALTAIVCGPALLAQSPAAASQANQPAKVLLFDLTSHGISPATVTVAPGTYSVTVRNGISLSQLSVRLDNEALAAVMQDTIQAGKSGLQKLVQLQAGKHTLTVGTRKEWTATIVVTASAH